MEKHIWLRARSHATSRYTWGSVTTLRGFGSVLGPPSDTFFWALQLHGHSLLALVCKVALSISYGKRTVFYLLNHWTKTLNPYLFKGSFSVDPDATKSSWCALDFTYEHQYQEPVHWSCHLWSTVPHHVKNRYKVCGCYLVRFSMFSIFYWLDSHNQTRVVIPNLRWKPLQKPDWKLDLPWLSYGYQKCIWVDFVLGYNGSSQLCALWSV